MAISTARLLVEPRRPRWLREHAHAHWYALAAVCVGAFIGQLDASIVTVALPTLQRTFHAGVAAVTSVGLTYLLVLIVAVSAAGRLGDRWGRKLVYSYGFVVFVAGSALCAAAPDLLSLDACRVVQAIGAAMLQANSVAIVYLALPRDQLTRGLGIQGASQALGLALGPSIGGALLATGGWRLIFLVNVPIGLAGAAAARLLVPRSTHLAGAEAGGRRQTAPLRRVRRKMSWSGPVRASLAASMLSYLLLFGTMSAVPFFLERDRGFSAARSGLILSCLPLAIALTAPLAGHFAGPSGRRDDIRERRRRRLLPAGGMILASFAIAIAGLTRPEAAWQLALLLAAIGAGLGAFTPANNAAIMRAAPPAAAGAASGLLNRTRAVGTALGLAVMSIVLTVSAGAGFTAAALCLAAAAAGAGAAGAAGAACAGAAAARHDAWRQPAQAP